MAIGIAEVDAPLAPFHLPGKLPTPMEWRLCHAINTSEKEYDKEPFFMHELLFFLPLRHRGAKVYQDYSYLVLLRVRIVIGMEF